MGKYSMRARFLPRISLGAMLLAPTPAVFGQVGPTESWVPLSTPAPMVQRSETGVGDAWLPLRDTIMMPAAASTPPVETAEPEKVRVIKEPILVPTTVIGDPSPKFPDLELPPPPLIIDVRPIFEPDDSIPVLDVIPVRKKVETVPVLDVVRDPVVDGVLQRIEERKPEFLDRPLEPGAPGFLPGVGEFERINDPSQFDPPLGFTGKSTIIPRTGSNADFAPIEDRWRQGFPFWDRYGLGFPLGEDYPYKLGNIKDPYNQNVLKGDYPIYGQHTFLKFTGTLSTLFEFRQLPTATTPFESTARSYQTDFFGRPNQMFYNDYLFLSFDLFHGDAAFKPMDWRVKLTPAFNFNALDAQEVGVVSPDVRKGLDRDRGWATLQEYFAEVKLADLSPEYDFVSLRVGSQPFTSDFRGFIFSDINRAARLFGTLNGNRDQFNLAFFRQAEKDTNSGLNGFKDRNQNIAIFNYYRQDFIFPGYTAQASVHYNDDGPSFLFDRNKFLVRPDPAGVFQPHRVQAAYLGFAGDGHIDRFNISHAFYWALGRDSMNPLAGQEVDINGKMAAVELSYDRDWARFRVSGFYQSGDGNINDGHATGFDSILDNVNFAGSEFSFWGRQQIPLFGVNVVQRNSIFSDFRSSKIQGQSNFVNPGLWIINAGIDFDITPRLRMINNANFMWFDKTNVIEQFVYEGAIDREIGLDLSCGFEYRPFLNNNMIMLLGASTLLPSNGFKQLYNGFGSPGSKADALFSAFTELVFTY